MCLRRDGLPETAIIDVIYGQHAKTIGITVAEYQAMIDGLTHRKRAARLAQPVSFLSDAGLFT